MIFSFHILESGMVSRCLAEARLKVSNPPPLSRGVIAEILRRYDSGSGLSHLIVLWMELGVSVFTVA